MNSYTNPGISTFPETKVTGISTRTNNADEMSAAKGRIASIWSRFEQEIAPQLSEGNRVFGVYSEYESDHSGDFSVLAGTDQQNLDTEADFVSRTIPAGRYLVFNAEGELPMAIINAWQRVWSYFQQPDCPHERLYTTDFEHYSEKSGCYLYIAVK
jgi:predicted transcriptional regulator YdeE